VQRRPKEEARRGSAARGELARARIEQEPPRARAPGGDALEQRFGAEELRLADRTVHEREAARGEALRCRGVRGAQGRMTVR
jgi:hypothetical protein